MSKEQPAFSCGHCHEPNPWWELIRHGDAVVSWACFSHLPEVALDLQRLGERTELVIREYRS